MSDPDAGGIAMTPITAGAAVAIARIEATLAGVKNQIDHQDRNTAQLVKMFEERMVTQLEEIKRRLGEMERAREQARIEQQRERGEIDLRLKDLERSATERAEKIAMEAKSTADAIKRELAEDAQKLDGRVGVIEKWRYQVVGVALGAGLASGGVVGIILKGVGGL